MGTKNTGIPNPGSFGNWTGGAGAIRGNPTISMPEDGWIDKVWVFTGGDTGGGSPQSHNFNFVIYRDGDGTVLAQTPSAAFSGKAWNSITFTLNSSNNNSASLPGGPLASPYLFLGHGYVFHPASYADGPQNFGVENGVSSWWWNSGVGIPSNEFSGWAQNPFGNNGYIYTYVEYWPALDIASISSGPVPVGGAFTITGRSFNAGINSINIGGVNVPTYTVNSDTQITATVPSGAQDNPVQVIGNAGQDTSSSALNISGGGNYKSGGVLHGLQGAWYKSGGTIHPVQGIWYKSGGVLKPTK